jgi:two-component sensor histidine kinase
VRSGARNGSHNDDVDDDRTLRSFPTGRTILRVLAAGRWLCLAWMTAVVIVPAESIRHPVVAWTAWACGGALAAHATWCVRHYPARLLRPEVALVEISAALAFVVLDGYVFDPGQAFATSQALATAWPIVTTAGLGLAAGRRVAAAAGLLFGPARALGAVLNDFGPFEPRHFVSIGATSVFYCSIGLVFGWLTRLLRDAQEEVAHQRAGAEMARVLHDTVLQTLALVDRRTRDTDPELAAAARRADHDVRAYLFGERTKVDSLRGALRTAIDGIAADHSLTYPDGHVPSLVVNVVDDHSLTPELITALTRAASQAVANALEHARATQIVVFADSDDDGTTVSIRDDGRGFDMANAANGIHDSIEERMRAVGGRAEIRSNERGTEVLLWVG